MLELKIEKVKWEVHFLIEAQFLETELVPFARMLDVECLMRL